MTTHPTTTTTGANAQPDGGDNRRGVLLGRPGAVAATGPDAGVAAHYGDPSREQRLLVEGLAVVDLSHRGVVTVTGPDRLVWLHSLTTQHLTDLSPGASTEALVLSPHGHVEHVLHVVDDGETTWLGVEPGTAPALVSWLERMRFLMRVEVRDASAGIATLGECNARPGAPGEPVTWVDPWPAVGDGSAAYGAAAEEHPGRARAWRELFVPREDVATLVADRPVAGVWAAEALRVAAVRPRHLLDTDHRTIPHEADWLRTAVHLQKGCYRGQETVARVHNLGRPPRRLVLAHLDGSGHVLPPAGADVVEPSTGAPAGRLTSVARHAESGPIALAMVKRKFADADVLTARDEETGQVALAVDR